MQMKKCQNITESSDSFHNSEMFR